MGVTQGGGYTAVIEVAQEPDGSFQWTNLNIAAGRDVGRGILRPAPFPALTSGFAAVGWGSDSRRVYYADADGAVIELKTDGSRWQFLNLTSDLGVPAARWNSALTTGGMRSGTMMVYYVDEGGGLIVLKSMKSVKSEPTWHSDIADFIPKVPATSPMAALQNGRGRFVYFFNKNGHVIEVEGFGKPPRRITDLTKFMNLPSPSPLSGLAATGWGGDHRHVYYADTNDSLIEMAGYGDENGRWSARNLASQGVRRLKDGSPLAAAPADGTPKGVALLGQGSEPLWANWENGWSTQEIFTTAAANSSVACAATTDGRPWVSYVDWNNHLSLWRGPGSDWRWWDLTAGLDLPAAAKVATQGPLALVQTERGTRIYYLTDEPDF
ncbi:hypothetical protein AB0F18_29220 [Streptomyces sp. NPDC029216]|uniref:hypothetical protein n=1 Tax=Streptomyces sp. NPDC029216 TaxID=3154701 RepID=UPI003407A937